MVADAKQRIAEIGPVEAREEVETGRVILFDVREASEWQSGHAVGARHASRGTIEIGIEKEIPNLDQPIICHCGSGGRSALVADSLQKMG